MPQPSNEVSKISVEEKLYQLIDESLKRKSMYGRERNDLMREVLIAILSGLMIPAAFLLPNLPLAVNPILKSLSQKFKTPKRNIIKSIYVLKRNELIKSSKNKIILTEKGRHEIFKKVLQLIELPQPAVWDRKWRVIIFDIPEKFHNARNALRDKIKDLGLYQIQKSAYIYPHPFKQEIDLLTRFFGVYEYLIYLEVSSIEGEQFLLQHFQVEKH